MSSCKILKILRYSNLPCLNKWQFRNYCKAVAASENQPKPKKTRNMKSHSKQLNDYLQSGHLLPIKDKLPDRLLRKNRKVPDDLYLIDRKIGKRIADIIIPDLKKSTGVIIETNPGFGFVTKELLMAGFTNLHIYESTVAFRNYFFKLNEEYDNMLKIYNKDFFSIYRLHYQDKYDNGNRVKNMLSAVPVRKWDDDAAMNIIGILPVPNFISHLILSLVFQYGIMTYGRNNLYICIPPSLLFRWTAKPGESFFLYRATSVLFQLFCDHTLLEKFPRKAFLPWDSVKEMKDKTKDKYPFFQVDIDYLYLTKISFKPLPVPVEKLQALWIFIKHLMISRKNYVIPMLEKWIPGCGWNLITLNPLEYPDLYPNINIYTKIGDLTPQQILCLFKLFSSWPEYNDCSFIATMEASLLKMETSSDYEIKLKENQDHEQETSEIELENVQS